MGETVKRISQDAFDYALAFRHISLMLRIEGKAKRLKAFVDYAGPDFLADGDPEGYAENAHISLAWKFSEETGIPYEKAGIALVNFEFTDGSKEAFLEILKRDCA